MTTTTFFGTLNHHTCGECGLIFGLEAAFDATKQRDGTTFYCPNGHARVYRETALQRMERTAKRTQELLEAERRANESLRKDKERLYRQRAAACGQVTRLKNRAKAGVCPCCNRTFSQLARHMADKHPEFGATNKGA